MSKVNSEIKLAEFSDDLREVIKSFKERGANQASLIAKVWEFFNERVKDGDSPVITPFSSDEVKEVSSLLLKRVNEEKKGKEIADVLAVCYLVMDYGDTMKELLIDGGLAVPLMVSINSHLDEVDVVERGLFTAGSIAHDNPSQVKKLITLGIVFTLEMSMESYPKNHNVMWAASNTYYWLNCGKEAREVLRQSKLPRLLKKVKVTFPKHTLAHQWADVCLD